MTPTTIIRIASFSIAVSVVAVDRAPLASAFLDPDCDVGYTTLTLRAQHAGRTADFTAEIAVLRDVGVVHCLSIDACYGEFCRAMSTVISRPISVGTSASDDALRSGILDAETNLSAAFCRISISSIPSPSPASFDLARVLPLLVACEGKAWRHRIVTNDVAELEAWIAKNNRQPAFSWTGDRLENALAIRAHSYARRLATADGTAAPENPIIASTSDLRGSRKRFPRVRHDVHRRPPIATDDMNQDVWPDGAA